MAHQRGNPLLRPGQPVQSSFTPCPTTGARGEPLIGPIIELGHDLGSTVIGGYIYRGTAMPSLNGKYIFGDWSTGGAGGDGTILVSTPPPGSDISRYPFSAASITPGDNLHVVHAGVQDSEQCKRAGECICERVWRG